MPEAEIWRPGSFTKNFSWGRDQKNLKRLYDAIRAGFAGSLRDVPRESFRQRVAGLGRPDYIAINFFLFNRIEDGVSYLVADELVFQAIEFDHSPRFDRLALFAFNLSLAGTWKGAEPYQRYPALWARHYVTDRVAEAFNWDTAKVSANDIEKFVFDDPRYAAQGARKLATNLKFLYDIGGLHEMGSPIVERWWVDAIFLALDRILLDRKQVGRTVDDSRYGQYLAASRVLQLTKRSLEKELALPHLIELYRACGKQSRFSDDQISELTKITLPDIESYLANDTDPVAAIHLSNPRIIKTIPRVCAQLARYVAGFEILDITELTELDIGEFIRSNLKRALEELKRNNVSPKISAEELMKLMREG